MNLTTTYMGFELPHPIIPGASPRTGNVDGARRLEDAGAPLIVMPSLFEEQVIREELAVTRSMEAPRDSYAESLSYFPELDSFHLGPDEYLDQLRSIKEAVTVPVIASLNGTTDGGWLRFARLLEATGADGLELNLYEVAGNVEETGEQVERRALHVVRAVKDSVSIPLAVKLSPFYSCFSSFARQLDGLGVEALVLFNRFYQPDIDVEHLETVRVVNLSDSSELLLRLRWVAMLYGRVLGSLAASGGVHTVLDVVKAIMTGASVVQMVSALLRRGPSYLTEVRDGLARWLEEHEYESLRQMQGSMSLLRSPDPSAYERANYVKILQTWREESL